MIVLLALRVKKNNSQKGINSVHTGRGFGLSVNCCVVKFRLFLQHTLYDKIA